MGEIATNTMILGDLFGDTKKEFAEDFLDARGDYASWTTHIPTGNAGDPEIHIIQEFDLNGLTEEFVVRQAFGIDYMTYGHISYWPPRARDKRGKFKTGPRVELFG